MWFKNPEGKAFNLTNARSLYVRNGRSKEHIEIDEEGRKSFVTTFDVFYVFVSWDGEESNEDVLTDGGTIDEAQAALDSILNAIISGQKIFPSPQTTKMEWS